MVVIKFVTNLEGIELSVYSLFVVIKFVTNLAGIVLSVYKNVV